MERDRTGAELQASEPLAALASAKHYAAFFSGLAVLLALLVPYIGAQVLGFACFNRDQYVNEHEFLLSIGTNVVLWTILAALYLAYRLGRRSPSYGDKAAYPLVVAATAALLAATILHSHIVGTLNSLHILLVLGILILMSWVLNWREAILFVVIANASLATLLALEVTGRLRYAPLFRDGPALARIFLDWRTVLGQSVNYLLLLVAFLSVMWKLRRALERSEREREDVIRELQETLQQVKTLQGLLPICAKCKRIRDDQGYWNQIESYFRKNSGLSFTHSLCPDCAQALYPDLLGKAGPRL